MGGWVGELWGKSAHPLFPGVTKWSYGQPPYGCAARFLWVETRDVVLYVCLLFISFWSKSTEIQWIRKSRCCPSSAKTQPNGFALPRLGCPPHPFWAVPHPLPLEGIPSVGDRRLHYQETRNAQTHMDSVWTGCHFRCQLGLALTRTLFRYNSRIYPLVKREMFAGSITILVHASRWSQSGTGHIMCTIPLPRSACHWGMQWSPSLSIRCLYSDCWCDDETGHFTAHA